PMLTRERNPPMEHGNDHIQHEHDPIGSDGVTEEILAALGDAEQGLTDVGIETVIALRHEQAICRALEELMLMGKIVFATMTRCCSRTSSSEPSPTKSTTSSPDTSWTRQAKQDVQRDPGLARPWPNSAA